jgi:predicted ester cyclase
MLGQFDDFRIDVQDVLTDGEKVAARWVAQGRYKGTMLAAPVPNGQPVRMTGMTIARVANGQIIEGWNKLGHHGDDAAARGSARDDEAARVTVLLSRSTRG